MKRPHAVLPVLPCGRCGRRDHERADCTTVLLLWTNGPDVMIAESAARAARVFNDPFGWDSDEDFYASAADDWKPIEGDLAVNGVTLPAEDWAGLFGEGFLVIDGELAPRDP